MADRELLVRIVGDDKDLQRALGNTDRRLTAIDTRTQKFGRTLATTFKAAGIAIGGAAIFRGLSSATQAAVDLNEEVSKSRQVFGQASADVEAFAKTTASSMGIAEAEALRATGTFGNLFVTIGLADTEASGMSTTLVRLAADLASFNNADPSDVLQAIRSGLIGEAEPLRRYGVLLSEARVQQTAMANTGKQNVKELTNQEKALARYQIILEDTDTAQGDFARTSDSLANQSRVLRARLQDLSAELGENLVPILIKAAGAANTLLGAFNALGQSVADPITIDVDNTSLAELDAVREKIAGIRGETDFMVVALDKAIALLKQLQPPRPDDRGGLLGVGAITASNAAVNARNEERAARQAKAAAERSRKAFGEFIKGQGLKLDKAGLSKSLNDDLAVLREIERGIRRRIAAVGRTFELEEQLTQNLAQQQAITEAQRADAQARAEEAADRRREAQERAAERRRQRFERRQRRRQSRQFEQLGLTSEGARRAPSAGALRRRLANVQEAVKGTVLDTAQTQRQLDRISAVLSGKFGKIGREVRLAILGMFNEITGALDEGQKGPLTKTRGLNTAKFLEGLGLSPEQIRELRGRLSGLNTAGGAAGGFQIGAPTRSTGAGVALGAASGIRLESHTTINLDGKQIAKVITKQQQKDKRRNPAQKRGPNRGGI